MLVLYHGGTSTASAKVRLALAEKGLSFESRLIDLRCGEQKSADYLAVNPAGVVPTLAHDGRVIVESSVILEYVDETWPDPPLAPASPAGRARMRLWLRRVDELHEACSILSSSVKLVALRDDPAAAARLLARTPDLAKRARQERLLAQGFDAPDVDAAIESYAGFLADADVTLRQQPFLTGDRYGLADCAALPYVHRLVCLGMAALWRDRPTFEDWRGRAVARPSFTAAIEGWAGEQAYAPSPDLRRRAESHA